MDHPGDTARDLSNFLTTAVKAGGEREDFLQAAVTATPVVLNDLIDTTDKLDGLARKSFLSVASDAGLHLEGVIDMAENVLGKMPDKFIDIFTSATSAGKYLGAFVETFA